MEGGWKVEAVGGSLAGKAEGGGKVEACESLMGRGIYIALTML